MGGINHQPCNQYLPASTKLSRSISIARAKFELSNVALEDVILLELSGKIGCADDIIGQLIASQKAIESALTDCKELRVLMGKNDFIDLPTLSKTNVQEVGRIFSDVGMVSIGHWNEISGQMQEGGFYFVLDFIENKLQGILDGTWNLLSGIRAISDGIVSGKANRIMEENLPGNIKVAFATLYQEWSHFQQYFLASSMLSTELWYRHTKVGSLCESAHEMSLATV